jgi:hypothetical protein
VYCTSEAITTFLMNSNEHLTCQKTTEIHVKDFPVFLPLGSGFCLNQFD